MTIIVTRTEEGRTFRIGENTAVAIRSADSAAISASVSLAAAGPNYATTVAGLAATTDGQAFAVDNGDGTVTVYRNVSGAAVAQRTLATTAYLASATGAELIGYGTDTVSGKLSRQPRSIEDYTDITEALASGAGNIRSSESGATYSIGSTLTLPDNTNLKLEAGSRIQVTADVNGVALNENSRLSGGTIDASGVAGFTSAALYVAGEADLNLADPAFVHDVVFRGPSDDTGKGIYLLADNASEKCSFNTFTGLYLTGFETGILAESASPGSGQYAYNNANIFMGRFYDFVRGLDFVGGQTTFEPINGNFSFNIYQPHGGKGNAVRALRDAGEGNFHIAYVWDWAPGNVAAGEEEKPIEIVDNGANQGGLHFIATNVAPWKVLDGAGAAYRRSVKLFYGSRFIGFSGIASAPFTSNNCDPVGNQDDYGVCADLRFTLHYQQATTAPETNGSWSTATAPSTPQNMFRLSTGSSGRSRWNFSGYRRVLIDLGANKKMQGLWPSFQGSSFPDRVTIRRSNTATSDPASVVWEEMYADVPGSRFMQGAIDGDFVSGQTRWLALEMYVDGAARDVDIERVSFYSNGEQGKAFVDTFGDNSMYGPLKMSGVQVLTTRKTGWTADTGTAKRTTNATYTGTASATYTQSEMTAVMNALKAATETIKALKDDLISHGVIGT